MIHCVAGGFSIYHHLGQPFCNHIAHTYTQKTRYFEARQRKHQTTEKKPRAQRIYFTYLMMSDAELLHYKISYFRSQKLCSAILRSSLPWPSYLAVSLHQCFSSHPIVTAVSSSTSSTLYAIFAIVFSNTYQVIVRLTQFDSSVKTNSKLLRFISHLFEMILANKVHY